MDGLQSPNVLVSYFFCTNETSTLQNVFLWMGFVVVSFNNLNKYDLGAGYIVNNDWVEKIDGSQGSQESLIPFSQQSQGNSVLHRLRLKYQPHFPFPGFLWKFGINYVGDIIDGAQCDICLLYPSNFIS